MVSTRSTSQGPGTPPPPPTTVPLNDLTPPTTIPLNDLTPPSTNGNGSPVVQMTADLSKSGDSVIPTPGGEVRVRPYRSSSNAQLKALLTFTPRVSALDRENVRSQADEFRGFFTLFWIGLALLFMRTSLESWEQNRTPLSWNFGRLITRDAFVLALSDGLMTATMFICVPFVKALQNRWISYYYSGLVIQHVIQTVYLALAVWWGYHRQWYWVQSGFLVLHCLSNLMKMHSYMAHNGMLATVYFRLQSEKAQLAQLIESLPESREELLEEAAARQIELERLAAGSGSATPVGTPGLISSSGMTSYVADPSDLLKRQLSEGVSTALAHSPLADPVELRRRSATSLTAGPSAKKRSRPPATDALPRPTSDLPVGTSLEPSHTTTPHEPHAPSPLAWSPNERIAILARNIDAMEEELRSNGAKGLVWPQNVTYLHFLDYLFIPTLVYQLEYPRTNTLRPWVVIEKIAATFGTFSLIYLITEHYIMPYTPQKGESLLRTYLELALPMLVNYLLIFYIIFECVCTGFAELSYFADREFYQDWWNSTSWDQFSRKWNKPVHSFLLRHVYASTMDGLQLSKTSATFVTFLLSALCHELVMAVVTKKIRPYLFLMQMAQLPMIALGRLPAVRRNKTVGNIVFWIGLMSGFPLLAICYLVW